MVTGNDTSPAAEHGGVDDADGFIASLEGQVELYGRLKCLVNRQRTLITADDPSQLLALLADRDRVTGKISNLATDLGPLSAAWERFRPGMPDGRRRRATELIRAVQEHLKCINSIDADDVKLLEVRKRRVAVEMQQVGTRGAMLNAYGRDGSPRGATRGLGGLGGKD